MTAQRPFLHAFTVMACIWGGTFTEALAAPADDVSVEIEYVQGEAQVLLAGASQWISFGSTNLSISPAGRFRLESGGEIKVGRQSRVGYRHRGTTGVIGPESHCVIRRLEQNRFRAFLARGWFYFFHRDEPGSFDLETPTVIAAVRGTEFVMKVEEVRTAVTVADGRVVLTNTNGLPLDVTNGLSAVTFAGQAPQLAKLESVGHAIQWCLHYPAVLDTDELNLRAEERAAMSASLTAYRQGDLLAALRLYPEHRDPISNAEKIYQAELLLSVGEVGRAEALLAEIRGQKAATRASTVHLSGALEILIAAVRSPLDNAALSSQPSTATEWLAESYARQSLTGSRESLEHALEAAINATALAPRFGFAWARVAELEFSFGRTEAASRAVEKSLELSPRNGQAMALQGFLLAAQNKTTAALLVFEKAMETDPSLGNAWLGRGLCRIYRGDLSRGREDLQIAATLEPQRAFLRSYLGKAFSAAGDQEAAEKEFRLAKELDPNDPTAWLYSALLMHDLNRINEAVRNLELSQELNGRRELYRSRFRLDEDMAVRSANLARISQDAGMVDVAIREAARGIATDYADFSSHLFLANSFNLLRDPNQVELRYETPWLNEYLLANLLAPPGAGLLSPAISQQEYSRLFEQRGLGVVSSTEYLSRGAWTESGAQYGNFGTFAYAAEAYYRTDPGQRANNDIEVRALDVKLKQQVTAKDSLYLQAITSKTESGDMTQYYYPTSAQSGFRAKETQEPIVLAGYHRQWSPESHTLLLAGVLNDTLTVRDPNQPVLFTKRDQSGTIQTQTNTPLIEKSSAPLDYESEFNAITLEGQQIWQPDPHSFIIGARYQQGEFDTTSRQRQSGPVIFDDGSNIEVIHPGVTNHFSPAMERATVYGYWNCRVTDTLLVTAGVTYDYLRFPENFRVPPISGKEDDTEMVSPKAGFVLTPFKGNTVRGAFTRSLGGVSFDQSFRLEPTQVGGFNQAYRGLIPESVAGSLSAATWETWHLGVDQQLASGSYVSVQLERMTSEASQSWGTLDRLINPPPVNSNSSVRRSFDYEERNLLLTFNQLIGDWFAVGLRYRLSEARMKSWFADVPQFGSPEVEGTLNQAQLFGVFNHPSGFFGRGEAIWTRQSNQGYSPDLPGDDFWQFNVQAGYRFLKRRAEVSLGLLNIGNQDYHLNPLNLTRELPRERTLAASLRLNF